MQDRYCFNTLAMQKIGVNLHVTYCFRTAVTSGDESESDWKEESDLTPRARLFARRFESFSNPAGETGAENDNRIGYFGVGSRIAKTSVDGLRRQALSGIRQEEAHDRNANHITTQ
jgi:hypothetical protein